MKPVHEDIAEILADEADDRFASPVEARRKAMDFLARREYGRGELIDKLVGKGFDAGAAGAAVAKLAEEGLQSDLRFAEAFVRSRIGQGKGPVRIRVELEGKGLSGAAIDDALDAAGADWHALAREQRRKKFGQALPADFRDKARQMRFLQYRGFETEHVQAAVGPDAE